jgi:hypothetical protein
MKRGILIVTCMLMILALSACKATPKESIVKEKSLDHMIEEATKTQPTSSASTGSTQAGATQGTQSAELAQKMGAPTSWQKELVDATGKVRIHVDAQVQVPDATGVSVQRVAQAKFTQAQVDTLVSRLMKGELFSGNGYKTSKSEIQKQILEIQAAVSNGTATSSPKDKGGTMLPNQLSQLQEDLKTAPDVSVKTPITSKLTPMAPDDGPGEELFALSQPATNVFQSFHAYNYDDGTSFLRFASEKNAFSKSIGAYFATKESIEATLSRGEYSVMTKEELAAVPDIKITKEDARKTADELVAALGLKDFVCVSEDKEYGGGGDRTADMSAHLNPRRCVWFLRFAHNVSGVPLTYTVYDCMKVETDQQSAPWAYEDMTLAIDDDGIAYFDWESPYQMEDLVTRNSNVLSFGDVTNVFNTMALVQNAWDGLTEGWSIPVTGFDINVTRIVFGLTRVTEQNKRNSGLLVPCWDFFADTTFTQVVNGKTVTKAYDTGYPLLTINAIDGTVINRSLGY